MKKGTVYLIGAGPGDPRLLTLRGAELMARCDVVLYDGLSNNALLEHAPTAEHICVGKHGQTRIWRQEEIIAEMLLHASGGRQVARLKGGDPAVFARTAEEVDALIKADIPFEIVPGITAALAAGSYAGIPITHRGLASAVALVTGHEEPGKLESSLDWDALAKFPGTLVIYMGVTTASVWSRALLDAGKPADTPAAIVRRCSLPDQQTLHCRLDEVADRLTPASKFRPPAIVILGAVTRLAETMDWVRRRPLFGQTVLVSRPAEQAEALAGPLRELGAMVLIQPAIAIEPPVEWSEVDTHLSTLDQVNVVVFCSRNAVRYFLNRLFELGHDARALAGTIIAVIGSQTEKTLAEFHLQADLLPSDFRAESLAELLAPQVNGKNVLIVRADRGREVLGETLKAAGAKVTEVAAYRNRDVEEANPEVRQFADGNTIDWVTVTSSATANNLHRMFPEMLATSQLASLSPVTSETLRSLGYRVAVEADPYTIESLIQVISDHVESNEST